MRGIAAVVLAAGAASRYGSPKQLLLLPEVLERLAAAALEEIVVVAGAHELPTAGGPERARPVRIVSCPHWRAGPGASLRCGLAALGGDCRAAVVVLADGPDLDPAAIERVVASWEAGGGDVVAASYGGVRGHPLLVARPVWDGIPDEGLRLRRPRLVPCDDLRHPGDVDRPEDLPARLRP